MKEMTDEEFQKKVLGILDESSSFEEGLDGIQRELGLSEKEIFSLDDARSKFLLVAIVTFEKALKTGIAVGGLMGQEHPEYLFVSVVNEPS